MIPASIFPLVIPHHTPGSPLDKVTENINASGTARITVLKIVTTRALMPLPVPWNMDDLFGSVVTQTVLSIYWGLLGFAGMIWGARSSRRLLWLAGAGFMALVVIKLFLVDLGNSGTVERIISFIGIGALLLVVGYFAPAPPRHSKNDPGGDPKDDAAP